MARYGSDKKQNKDDVFVNGVWVPRDGKYYNIIDNDDEYFKIKFNSNNGNEVDALFGNKNDDNHSHIWRDEDTGKTGSHDSSGKPYPHYSNND